MGTLSDISPAGISLQDLFGSAPVPAWAPALLRFINTQQRVLQQAMQGRLGVENMGWDFKTALFSHGVPLLLSTTKVVAPKGVIPLSADGQSIASIAVQPSPVPKQVKVTVFFVNNLAVNVNVALLILPDGVASGK